MVAVVRSIRVEVSDGACATARRRSVLFIARPQSRDETVCGWRGKGDDSVCETVCVLKPARPEPPAPARRRKRSVSFDDVVTVHASRGAPAIKAACWYGADEVSAFVDRERRRRRCLGLASTSCITPQSVAVQEAAEVSDDSLSAWFAELFAWPFSSSEGGESRAQEDDGREPPREEDHDAWAAGDDGDSSYAE